jgi:hypothetical protein
MTFIDIQDAGGSGILSCPQSFLKHIVVLSGLDPAVVNCPKVQQRPLLARVYDPSTLSVCIVEFSGLDV